MQMIANKTQLILVVLLPQFQVCTFHVYCLGSWMVNFLDGYV